MNGIQIIIKAAEDAANDSNHKRSGRSYFDAHLYPVMVVGELFMFLIPAVDQNIVRAALALHDAEEDHRLTFNDITVVTNSAAVAEIVHAVTNEKGKNRDERANEKYYEGIRNTKYATFVKLCDRLHNVADSKMYGSSMFNKYYKENEHFLKSLRSPELGNYTVMINMLNTLLNKL